MAILTARISEITHTGIVVPDLATAMSELAATLGLQWAPVQQRNLTVLHERAKVNTDLGFTYSVDGPPHLELITAQSGTPWERAGMHHVGFWSDDLAADAAVYEAGGARLEATYASQENRPVGFVYLMTPSGLRLELVDAERRPGFEAWLAGGDFPAMAGN